MTTSRRVAERKVARFERSALKKSPKKGYPVSLIVLGFFVFGVLLLALLSAYLYPSWINGLFQMIRTARNRGMA